MSGASAGADSPGLESRPTRWADDLGPGSPVVAFDVGGTDIKCCLVDAEGGIVEIRRVPAPEPGPDAGRKVVDVMVAVIADLAGRHPGHRPAAVGLVVPGTVDERIGVGVYSANLRWSMVPFREMAEADLRLPVAFGHDVRAAGTAEFRLGAAAPFRDVIVMTIGTGIAAAVFVDARLHTGDGFAGETGHARVASGPRCGCGGQGCLEAVASASAIARRYTEATGKPVTGAKAVLERATAGEVAAVNVWETALDGLALGLSHASMLLAPEAIVLGGGLAQAGRALTGPLQQRLEVLLASRRRPQLLPAAVGEDAGVIGAALMARDLDVAGVSSVSSRAGAPVTTGDRSS